MARSQTSGKKWDLFSCQEGVFGTFCPHCLLCVTVTETRVTLGSTRYLQRRATTVFYDDFSSAHIEVRLQEIPSGWLYKNSSKNRAKLSLVFGHFFQRDNQWFVHNFYIQDQGGCQMCLSAVKLDHSGELFWDTPSWLSAWVSVFWAWRMDLSKRVPTLFAYCKKKTDQEIFL